MAGFLEPVMPGGSPVPTNLPPECAELEARYRAATSSEDKIEALDIIRVYSKPPGKEPDLSAPFPLKRGSTIDDLAGKIHRDLRQHLKSARVWGKEVFDGQPVGRDYVLRDGDIVELRA
jgi:ribosome-interacting GTPase 1